MSPETQPGPAEELISEAVETIEQAFEAADDAATKGKLVEELDESLHGAGYMIVPIESEITHARGRIAGLTRDEILDRQHLSYERRQQLRERIRGNLPGITRPVAG